MKIINFYCDIVNTYTSNDLSNRDKELMKFAKHLNELKEIEEADKLIFYFASDLDKGYIEKYCQELKSYLRSDTIELRKLERNNLITFYDKILLITDTFISNIKNNINNELILYFADDSDINHFLLYRNMGKKLQGFKHVHFVLSEKFDEEDDLGELSGDPDGSVIIEAGKNIEALNSLLEKHLKNYKNKEINKEYKKAIN